MANIKNIDTGPRGVNTDEGLVMIPAGATAEGVTLSPGERKAAEATKWFEFDGAAGDDESADDLDTTVANLRAIADDEGVDLAGITAKADIQAAIRAKREGAGDPSELDGMDDDTLRTTTAAITGQPEAELAGKNRDELLALARGA